MKTTVSTYGRINDKIVEKVTIENLSGMIFECINYGCAITKIQLPDKNGRMENIILSFDSLEEYIKDTQYVGTIVGRVGGRIKNAQFELNGKIYNLTRTSEKNHLHGGKIGLTKVVWDMQVIENNNEVEVNFTHTSSDGEEGYPGMIQLRVTYTITDDNKVKITYHARSNEDTILSLTNHSYFNLSGDAKETVLNHKLMIKSNQYAELGSDLIPTGRLLDVSNTPFNLKNEKRIEECIMSNHPHVALVGGGFDHPFLLHSNHNGEIQLSDEKSGRKLVVETDEPAVVVYSGNFLKADGLVENSKTGKYYGICLETQCIPDAVNHSHFPSIVLKKNELYQSSTIYSFQIAK